MSESKEYTFSVRRYDLALVLRGGKTQFNTSNHGSQQPLDYAAVNERIATRNWAAALKPNHTTVAIDHRPTLAWMKRAAHIGALTGRVSHMFADEVADLVASETAKSFAAACQALTSPTFISPTNPTNPTNPTHTANHADPTTSASFTTTNSNITSDSFNENNEKKGVFIRTDLASLKYGLHGAGPYYATDFARVVESLISSSAGHECLRQEDDSLVLYLFPWVHINPDREFRVFVHKNNITAVSHQNLYSVNRSLAKMSDAELRVNIIDPLQAFFAVSVRDTLADFVDSYTMDFALIPGGTAFVPYFIEINPFGAAYSAGSALFHWINDEALLLGDGSHVELRFNDHD
ncbi:hypothetical protein HK100_011709, partial [Physocladia obscura]